MVGSKNAIQFWCEVESAVFVVFPPFLAREKDIVNFIKGKIENQHMQIVDLVQIDRA